MSKDSIDDLLDRVYQKANSYDPEAIVQAYDYNVIYEDIGPYTLGTRITNNRRTTIILDKNLEGSEQLLVPLHEIKHCLTDKGVGTPFLRRMGSYVPVGQREYEANCFALNAMSRMYADDLVGLTKYQICQFFGLNSNWARFL